MLLWNQYSEWEQMESAKLDHIALIKQFYDGYKKTYSGIIALLDELCFRLERYGATYLKPIFLNVYSNNHSFNIQSLRYLQANIFSGRLENFSISSMIARSEEFRDTAYRNAFYQSQYGYARRSWWKNSYLDDPLRHYSYYDFIYDEFLSAFPEKGIPSYSHRIVANLLPFLYYSYVDSDSIGNFESIFAPTTAKLLVRLSTVKKDFVQVFVHKYADEIEAKYILVFLRAEFKWRLNKGEESGKLVAEFLSFFIGSELDDCIYSELLEPIYNSVGYHDG